MKKARVLVHGVYAGILEKLDKGKYQFSYHPDYSGAPVSLTMPIQTQYYLSSCSSISRSQLIFTTHNVLLIDQKIFRRDELWVAERDQQGASKLCSIGDYNSRNDKDIRKSYLQGRFGGIPRIILSEAMFDNAQTQEQ